MSSVNEPNRNSQLQAITTEIKKEGIETHINYVDRAGNEHTVTYDIELNNFGYSEKELAALTVKGQEGDHKAQLVAIANSISAKFHATINQYSRTNELDSFFKQKDISISSKHLDSSSSTTALTYQFGTTAISLEYTIDSKWHDEINNIKQYMLENNDFIKQQALLLKAYKEAAQNDVSEDVSAIFNRFKAKLTDEEQTTAQHIYNTLKANNVVFRSTYTINQDVIDGTNESASEVGDDETSDVGANGISARRRDDTSIAPGVENH